MKTSMTALRRSLAAFCLFLMVAQTASAFVIDSFDTAALASVQVTAVAPATANNYFTPGGGGTVMGGQRDIDVWKTYGIVSDAVRVDVNPGDSFLGFQEYTDTRGQFWVTWDGADNQAAKANVAVSGLGSQDFTVDGNNQLAVNLYMPTLGDHSLSIQLWDNDSNYTFTKTVTAAIQYQRVIFGYSTFTANGIDMTKIGAVQMGWVTDPTGLGGLTANFDYLETENNVPEPGTMALMAALMGMGGFGALRKRLFGVKQPVVA